MIENKMHRLAGYFGLLLVIISFLLGLAQLTAPGWLLLFVGAFLLAYSFYTGSHPYLKP